MIAALGLGFAASDAHAFVAGNGKGKAERDCCIGRDGYTEDDLSPINEKGAKPGIVCTGYDPACALERAATSPT